MRRATIIIGLTSSAATIALAALIYGISSHQSISVDNPRPDEAGLTQQAPSADETAPTIVPQQLLGTVQDPAVSERLSDTDYVPPCTFAAEESSAKMAREEAMRGVHRIYSLLFEDLDLIQSEKDVLLSLLIEDRIARTTTPCVRGRAMDEQDRSSRIAAIIGNAKLQQFLALERNLGSYWDVQYAESILQQYGVPITETQRDGLFEIMLKVRNQELTVPGADAERGSIEYLEYRLAQIDERERLIFEQAASVLAAEQVRYLFEQYQRDSYRRADALERQKKARADDNAEDLPLHYPARSYPDTPQ